MPRWLPARSAWLAALLLSLWISHGSSAQPMDLWIVRDPAAADYDFAWVYWFETHGQGFLREAVSDRPLPWDTPASRRWRGEAEAALMQMLDDRDDLVRASAVLSLARMGHEPVLDRVLPALDPPADDGGALPQAALPRYTHTAQDQPGDAPPKRPCLLLDRSVDVRLSAWLALGLIDNERTRAALAAPPMEDAEDRELAAQALAIGLLGAPDESHLRWLVARLDDADTAGEVKRWCLWSLRQHDEERFDVVFDAVLANLPSTFLVSEVLLNRAYVQRRGGALWLKDVLRYHPDVQDWPAYRALSSLPAGGYFGSTPRRLAMETRIAATLTLAHQPVLERADDRRDLLEHLRGRIIAGNSAQAMDFNRGFDMISYAMHCHGNDADLELLYDQLRGFTVLPADDPAVLEELDEGAVPKPEDLLARQSDNEVRGYSAIAVGLLIRRATQDTALNLNRPIVGRERIDIERLKRRFGLRLMRAVADEDEPMSYRAACALALGLTGDDRYAGELAGELVTLRAGDEAVLGYGLLALALLGDERAAVPARRYVTRPGKIAGLHDRLGRRAALQALAIIGEAGGADTADALAGAWGRDPWVGVNAAQASAWAGRYGVLPAILASTQSESVNWRRAAAVSLGCVFDRSSPSRLAPIIQASNPALSYRPDTPEQPGLAPPDGPEDPVQAAARAWPTRRLNRLADPVVEQLLWP